MSTHTLVTTPIYYSNGIPHIWHAYSSFLADTIARYKRIQWDAFVRLSTWVDENSQKVVESAQSAWMQIMEYADMMAGKHREVWDGIGIAYTDFIRTTEPRHRDFVQKVLQKSFENGDIYEWVYEWLYCVGCEGFKKESDLIEKEGEMICPDHPNKPLSELKEKNYFFRLSRYEDMLLDFYKNNPEFITPRNRFTEIIEFVKSWLDDFSVSRETNKFGIPLPFDPSQVTYVWYDALFNYLTLCQWEEELWWPQKDGSGGEVLHIIGKDIARFHAIYWPAMLWSAGYEPPTQLVVTGHFTVDGQKMSKTIGNVIDPVSYIGEYSRDMLILYIFSAFPIGEDGDFDRKEAILQYNARLANNLWNLLNRFITLSLKVWGKLDNYEDVSMVEKRQAYISKYKAAMTQYSLKDALDESFAFSTEINQFIDTMKPWKLDPTNPLEAATLRQTLSTVWVWLFTLSQSLMPFFEEKMTELLERIGFDYPGTQSFDLPAWFTILEKWTPLYSRIEIIPNE